MTKRELEQIELTNMCMIEDLINGKVLIQVRNKNEWDGISFPGGHIEKGESIVQSVKREVKEETGLEVDNLKQCGIKDWYDFEKEKRYVVLFYKTTDFSGTLIPRSDEGENKWMSLEEIYNTTTAPDFLEMLDIFVGKNNYTEFFYEDTKNTDENKRWIKKKY